MSGIKITGILNTKSGSDDYPTHNNNFSFEGFFVVDTITQRNLISTQRRGTKCSALVIDRGDGEPGVFIIDDSVDISDNANWTEWQSALVQGGVLYQGNWDANTNTPTLVDATGNNGEFYVVDVAGSQDLGSGSQTFAIGDWVIYDGGIWRKLAQAGNTNDWDTMINKPATFPPSSHTHPISEITNLQTTLDGKFSSSNIDTVAPAADAAKVTASSLIKEHFDDTAIHFEIDDNKIESGSVWSSSKINDKFLTDTLTPDEINTLFDNLSGGINLRYLEPLVNSISDLKSVPTVGIAVGKVIIWRQASDSRLCAYELIASTQAEQDPNIIRPNDYAASTNEKVWVLATSGQQRISTIVNTSATETIDFDSFDHIDLTADEDTNLKLTGGTQGVEKTMKLRPGTSTSYNIDMFSDAVYEPNTAYTVGQILFHEDISGNVWYVVVDDGFTSSNTGDPDADFIADKAAGNVLTHVTFDANTDANIGVDTQAYDFWRLKVLDVYTLTGDSSTIPRYYIERQQGILE